MVCKLIEQPDRIIIRLGIRGLSFTFMLLFGAIIIVWWLMTAITLCEGEWHFLEKYFSIKSSIGLDLAGWCLGGLGLMLFFWILNVTSGLSVSIYTNGWVRTGLIAWKFPGPVRVRCVIASSRCGINFPMLKFSYGKVSFRVRSYDPVDRTTDIADKVTEWANRRIIGVPDKNQIRTKKETSRIYIGVLYIILVIIGIFYYCSSSEYHYYLNEYATMGSRSIIATTGSAIISLVVPSWYWLWVARCGIKAGMTVWLMRVLIALPLIAIICGMAMYFGQILDMRAAFSHEVTLFQPVHYYYNGGKGCTFGLHIQEPALGRSVDYELGCSQYSYWARAGGMAEVHQVQNELGVHILSVRRIDAPWLLHRQTR